MQNRCNNELQKIRQENADEVLKKGGITDDFLKKQLGAFFMAIIASDRIERGFFNYQKPEETLEM